MQPVLGTRRWAVVVSIEHGRDVSGLPDGPRSRRALLTAFVRRRQAFAPQTGHAP